MSPKSLKPRQTESRCLVRGSINIDEFFHVSRIVTPGETLSSTRYERRAGGKGANQAVAVAKAAGHVSMIASVGTDGDWIVNLLRETGVDVDLISVTNDEPTGRAIIQLTPEGENCILLHRGANFVSHVLPNYPPFTHCLLQNEIPLEDTLATLSYAHSTGATTIFNPSPLPSREELRSFPWKNVDWLIVNQGEAISLIDALKDSPNQSSSAGDATSKGTKDSGMSILHALRHLPTFASSVNIVCTLGSEGVIALLTSGVSFHVPVAKLDGPVKDTTGAGDCFTGYFVAGLMESASCSDLDVQNTLQMAVKAAGICVQYPGAMESIPDRTQVDFDRV